MKVGTRFVVVAVVGVGIGVVACNGGNAPDGRGPELGVGLEEGTEAAAFIGTRGESSSPPEIHSRAANCGLETTCGGCTPNPGCGWCKSLGRCLAGKPSGANEGRCKGADWQFAPNRCGS